MRGFPNHLNTKQDYLNVLLSFPEETKAALKEVYDARFTWFPVRKLKAGENPKETAVKKIMELPLEMTEEGAEPQTERWLYELKEDPNAWFFRLGFTAEEAEKIINE